MKRLLTFATLAVALAGTAWHPSATAAVVTYGYTGIVDDDSASRGYSAFTGQFSFDTTVLDQIADPQTADYKMGAWPQGLSAVFDGGAASVSITDAMDLLVTNNLGGMDTLGPLARTSDLVNALDLSFYDFSAAVFNSDAMPGGQLTWADFGWGTFSWESADGLLTGHLTALSCLDGCGTGGNGGGGNPGACQPGSTLPCPPTGLPEPTAPTLTFTALAAMAFMRRRSTRDRF